MPYIHPESRRMLDNTINNLIACLERHTALEISVGELNYVVTCLVFAKWRNNTSYSTGNAIIGMLECAKTEFYRRHLAPYEDEKIKQNGDVDFGSSTFDIY